MADIKILTMPGCTGCKTVEKMLDKMGVKYNAIDITKNPGALKKWQVFHAPGIVINGKLEFSGVPGEDELKKKLGMK